MICSIEALKFRCLRYVQRPLLPFHVLVGPNASGKTTFLDVVSFLELEIWVWSDSPHVAAVLGWAGRQPDLMTWLINKGMFDPQKTKPDRPKEAMVLALREARKSRSSAIFLQLAELLDHILRSEASSCLA